MTVVWSIIQVWLGLGFVAVVILVASMVRWRLSDRDVPTGDLSIVWVAMVMIIIAGPLGLYSTLEAVKRYGPRR